MSRNKMQPNMQKVNSTSCLTTESQFPSSIDILCFGNSYIMRLKLVDLGAKLQKLQIVTQKT